MSNSPEGARAARTVHVGRQAVLDRKRAVIGHELLFRRDSSALEATHRDSGATSQVIVTSITDIGLESLGGGARCFLNLTREFVTGELPLPFGPDKVVLEILETIDVDDAVVAGVRRLVNEGYEVALDDFVPGTGADRLLPLAAFVKVDVLESTRDDILATLALCRAYPQITVIAERVENAEHMEFALAAGFDGFQGYAISRPEVVSAAALPAPRLRGMELLGMLVDNNLPHSQVSSLITSDATLSVRMLAAANADPLGLPVQVKSVQEAILLLGEDRLRDWTTLMLAGDTVGDEEVLRQTPAGLGRARMAQNLARRLNLPADEAFVVGLVSTAAEALGTPTAELAPRLSLNAEITDALTDGTGALGNLLGLITAYEVIDPPRHD
ncbi:MULTISPECIES: EAL and HDOD domain-containing protein [Catenuloplanes]|uniref:EAL and modified HD-GYP domain-containing signal transduction protein n=1 Tax=Catenuloplanes niger TaxID=587534 RepID=A0AAE4A1Y2_9ACTN|nr:HDOD domain-containing protein [Catenuloplanes niger]MDR7328088.1 EAL and modified HD-GYP domain-containing signal transduction protein [Catenuloplanes niger]